jgi:hypothetical protein
MQTDDYIKRLVGYLRMTTGETTVVKPLEDHIRMKIPIVVLGSFILCQAHLFQNNVIFAFNKVKEDLPPKQLRKLMLILGNRTGYIPIYVSDSIHSYNKLRLVKQRVNFIMPGNQMFIPSLLIDFKKQKTKDEDITKAIPPMAQVLLLYQLEVGHLSGLTIKDISNRFLLSYATVNRAFRWLLQHKLMAFSDKRTVSFPICGRELWNKALPYLRSPLDKKIQTDANRPEYFISGINALSHYTMINEEGEQYFAVSKEKFRRLKATSNLDYGDSILEVWRYDPEYLSNKGIVDRLSLYLLLRENRDERIQIELENMINEVKWL